MKEQIFSLFAYLILIGIVILIVQVFVVTLLGRDPLGLRPVMNLQRYGFAVDPNHPFADRLNAALESAFDNDEEVNE